MDLGLKGKVAVVTGGSSGIGLASVRQFLADLTPLTPLDPRYADRLDPDGITEALHDASPSLPATILRSRKDADALAQQRAQAQQATQMLDMLGQGAGAAKDLAAAGLPMGPGGEGMPQ